MDAGYAGHLTGYRDTQQEIAPGIAGVRLREQLPLLIAGQLRRKHGVKLQISQRCRIVIQMPLAAVIEIRTEPEVMVRQRVAQLLADLPCIVEIADFADGSPKGRVALQINLGHPMAIGRMRCQSSRG